MTSSCYFIRPQFNEAITKNTRCRRCSATWDEHYPDRRRAVEPAVDITDTKPASAEGGDDVDSQNSLFAGLGLFH